MLQLPGRPIALLDRTVAEIYQVTTKHINQALMRNPDKFPKDFWFKLTKEEFKEVTICDLLSNIKYNNTLPYAFTWEGANMLATVLRSDVATERAIEIVRGFTALEKIMAKHRGGESHASVREILEVILQNFETRNQVDYHKGTLSHHSEMLACHEETLSEHEKKLNSHKSQLEVVRNTVIDHDERFTQQSSTNNEVIASTKDFYEYFIINLNQIKSEMEKQNKFIQEQSEKQNQEQDYLKQILREQSSEIVALRKEVAALQPKSSRTRKNNQKQ